MSSTQVRPPVPPADDRASDPAPDAGRRTHPRVALVARVVTALAVVPAAVVSAVGLVEGEQAQAVLPLALAGALALGVLALTRFSSFVLVALAARSSLDLVKLSRGDSGVERWLDPASMLSVLLLVAALAWLAAQVASGRSLRGSPLRTALLVFGAAAVISVIGSDHPQAGAVEVLRLLSIITMFVVVEQLVTDRASLVRVVAAVYAGLLVPLGYTALRYVLGNPPIEDGGGVARLTGPLDQANSFARFLAVMVVFGIALYPALERRLKLPMALVLALSTAFLVLTLTRAAVAAAVVGVVVVALAQRRIRTLVVLVVAGLLAFATVPDLGARYAALSVESGEDDNGLRWRLDYWAQVVPLVQDDPVTGIGLGTTELRTDQEKKPHGDVVRALVETGALGLVAYLAVHVLMLRTGWLALRRSARGSLEHAVGAGALGVAACFSVGSLGANLMSNVVSMWPLVALVAAASAIARARRD